VVVVVVSGVPVVGAVVVSATVSLALADAVPGPEVSLLEPPLQAMSSPRSPIFAVCRVVMV